MTADRLFLVALGASVSVHGLVLAFGAGFEAPVVQAPRRLEARLQPEGRAAPQLRETARAPSAPRQTPPPALRQAVPQHRPARRPEPVLPPPRGLVADVGADRPAPALVSAAVSAASGVSASPGPAATGSPPAAPVAPAYTPPGYAAAYLDNPRPAYPLLARRRGLEGTVRLEVRVSADGIPTSVKVRESGGHDTLDEAALTAVWHWRFVPARRGGEAVEAGIVVPIRFRLSADEG